MRLVYRFGRFLVAGLAVCSFGTSLAYADALSDMNKRIDAIRAKYTTTMGMYDNVLTKVDEISVLPNAAAIVGLSGTQFESALKGCWEAPLTNVKDAKTEAIDIKRAAEQFKNRTAMKELEDTKTSLNNAVLSVESCEPNAMKALGGDTTSINDETKAALKGKLDIVNTLRILTKHELPTRAKDLTAESAKLKTDLVAAIAKAEGEAAVAAKNPFGGGGKKEKTRVASLKALETDVDSLMQLVTKDMTEVPTELATTVGKVLKNITDVSALIGK